MKVFKDYAANVATEKTIFNKSTKEGDIQDGDLVIAVLDRGWVFVGFITILDDERIRLDCCHNIHRWGTTTGLGEIAIAGPTSQTILNPSGPVFGKPIFLMKASDAWLS